VEARQKGNAPILLECFNNMFPPNPLQEEGTCRETDAGMSYLREY